MPRSAKNGREPVKPWALRQGLLTAYLSPTILALSVLAVAQPTIEVAPAHLVARTTNLSKRLAVVPWKQNFQPRNKRTPLWFPLALDPAILSHAINPVDRKCQSEQAVGKKLAADLEQHVTLVVDPTILEYLNHLEQTILSSSNLGGCFVVKLVKDVESNAYSLPGGFLYVTTGLIVNAENEAQLVAALAHETGHVIARHIIKIEAQKQLWRRLSLVTGPAAYGLRLGPGSLVIRKLLRNAEFEADRLGLQYQSAAGYDPMEMVHLLGNTFPDPGEPPSFFARLFAEHPSTPTRIKRVKENIHHYARSQPYYLVDTSAFRDIKIQLAVLMGLKDVSYLLRRLFTPVSIPPVAVLVRERSPVTEKTNDCRQYGVDRS
jgi:hypothetical protein